jgi:hypothetical protein
MGNRIHLLFLLLVVFALSTFVSCKKSSKDTLPSATDTLTQNIYTIDSTSSPSLGTILTAPYDSLIPSTAPSTGLLLIMNQSGKVLNKLTTPGSAFCLNRWIINGQIRYTYLVNVPTDLHPVGAGEISGYAIIADSNLNTLQQVNFQPYAAGIFAANQGLDIHDFILISDSDYITLTYWWKYVTNIPARLNPAPNVSVVTPVIEEIKNGNVVWHWDASDDTTFYGSSIIDNNFADSTAAQDYIHMNSMFVDPTDNNLICSMRDQDQIMKINRTTGVVMWRLGGVNSDFALTPDMKFLYQHDATLVDSNQTLMLFDDGDPINRPYSRICEFHLDYVNKVVTSFKYFNIPEPFTDFTGSVQKLGNDYFIGGGTAAYMLDINYNTGEKVAEYKGTMASYRSYKY